jgi:hypothetical protein
LEILFDGGNSGSVLRAALRLTHRGLTVEIGRRPFIF